MLYAATRSKMGFRRWGLDAACDICTLRVFAGPVLLLSGAKKKPKAACMHAARSAPCRKKVAQSAKRHVASPLPRLRSLLCALHTTPPLAGVTGPVHDDGVINGKGPLEADEPIVQADDVSRNDLGVVAQGSVFGFIEDDDSVLSSGGVERMPTGTAAMKE